MGRSGGGFRARRSAQSGSSQDSTPTALAEAQALLQRAERKRGLEAVATYEQAVARFRDALRGGARLSAEDAAAAHFGLGESLQNMADALLSGSRLVADEDVQAAEASAAPAAADMLSQAVEHYSQVREEDGGPRVDALVNSGNALAAWTDVEADPSRALHLLERAVDAYRDAIDREPDAATYSNMGDALVGAAEAVLRQGDADKARGAYGQAMQAYELACARSSSDEGDDLPGLLYNWGVGLHSAGTNLEDLAALEQAAARLRSAADFNRGDAAVHNALGDTLAAAADRAGDASARLGLLHQALEEGYRAALRIDSSQGDALVGLAEVELALGRGSQGEQQAEHFRSSASAYAAALQRPTALGGFSDRCDVRYNAACAACLAGDLQAADEILRRLLAIKGTTAGDVLADPDFAALQGSPLFQELAASVGT